MHITALYTYPIKSCGALSHTEIEISARGPRDDRRWMIVSDDSQNSGMFITQREYPRLALVQPTVTPDCLHITAPDLPPLDIPLFDNPPETRQVVIWRDTAQAVDMGPLAAEWFSTHLGLAVRLVQMADHHYRRVDATYSPEAAQVGFADGYPLLLISQASLDDLNKRLIERGKVAVPMNRFRPNIVVEGCEPFAEDTWQSITANGISFDVAKPCARCVMTTVDQSAGKSPDPKEPLATLSTFRRVDGNKLMFGQNLVHRQQGILSIGTKIAANLRS